MSGGRGTVGLDGAGSRVLTVLTTLTTLAGRLAGVMREPVSVFNIRRGRHGCLSWRRFLC